MKKKNDVLLRTIGNIDDNLIKNAAPTGKQIKKTQKFWIKWGAMAACLCLIIATTVTITSLLKPEETDGGGTPIPSGPDHNTLEITPTLCAKQEVIDEIKNDVLVKDIQGWTENSNAALNFEYVIPIYSTINMTESSTTILETLTFSNQYMIPAIYNGKCIGTFTVLQHDGKWDIGSYEIGLDIETEMKNNEDRATCFISVSQLSGGYGFLTVIDTEEIYTPISGFGMSDTISGEQLLQKLKDNQNNNPGTDG